MSNSTSKHVARYNAVEMSGAHVGTLHVTWSTIHRDAMEGPPVIVDQHGTTWRRVGAVSYERTKVVEGTLAVTP